MDGSRVECTINIPHCIPYDTIFQLTQHKHQHKHCCIRSSPRYGAVNGGTGPNRMMMLGGGRHGPAAMRR